MKRFILLSTAIFTLFILMSCGWNNQQATNNSDKTDDFFEGVVTPGVLTGKHYDTNNSYTYYDELTINNDHSFELRVKTTGLYGGNVEIKTYYGTIKKHQEVYNGETKVWFELEGESDDNYINGISIEPNGTAVVGAHGSYHGFYLQKMSSVKDYHWIVSHQ